MRAAVAEYVKSFLNYCMIPPRQMIVTKGQRVNIQVKNYMSVIPTPINYWPSVFNVTEV